MNNPIGYIRNLLEGDPRTAEPGLLTEHIDRVVKYINGIILRSRLKPAIAAAGETGSGKSALLNSIFGEEYFEEGIEPGETKTAKSVDWDKLGISLKLVDTPGTGFSDEHDRVAKVTIQEACLVIQVINGERGAIQSDRELYRAIHRLDKPIVIALNKIDAIQPTREWNPPYNLLYPSSRKEQNISRQVQATQKLFRNDSVEIVPVSATEKYNIDSLILKIERLVPEKYRLAVARNVKDPKAKRELAMKYVLSSTVSAAAIGLSPIPVSDIIPLTILQAGLVTKIGVIYDHEIGYDSIKEVFLSAGAGVVFRTIFRQIVKVVPGAGSSVGAAMAAAGTYAIGSAAIEYFSRGMALKDIEIETIFDQYKQRFKEKVGDRLKGVKTTEDITEAVVSGLDVDMDVEEIQAEAERLKDGIRNGQDGEEV